MSIEKFLSQQDTLLRIVIDKKFDFSKVQNFRESYQALPNSVKTIVVDLSKTEYMDSSALGMLLNMQKSLNDRNINYKIVNCQEQVARILKISRFDKKFEIE